MGLQKEIVSQHKKVVFLHSANQASRNLMVINPILLMVVSNSGNFNYLHKRSSPNIELLLLEETILNTNLFSKMRVRISGRTRITFPFMTIIGVVIKEMDRILTQRIITILIGKLKDLGIKTFVKIPKILSPIISAQILVELGIKIEIIRDILEGIRIPILESMMISLLILPLPLMVQTRL